MNRREFLQVSGAASAGLIIGLPSFGETNAPSSLGPFIQIGADNIVTLWVTKSDMGQDVRTSLPVILAEELDADFEKVQIRQAHFDPKFGRQGTGGSSSVRSMWTPLRQAGATARAKLVAAAAAKWSVDAKDIQVANGVVSTGSNKATFGELADAASKIEIAADKVTLKDPKDFKLIGKPRKRLDTADIASGKAQYGIDVVVPGMLYASVLRAPVFGGRVADIKDEKAKAIAGVKHVVKIDAMGSELPWNGVAVVATSTWAAMKGRDALEVKWDDGPHAGESTESLRKELDAAMARTETKLTRGTPPESPAKSVAAAYEMPFLAHAAMEPLSATARVGKDGAELWLATQSPDWAARSAATFLGIEPAKVKVNVTMLGGGFGRRAHPDFALEAVQIAKAVGAPVKVTWTREDDMQHDYYRPATFHRIVASLDEDNNITSWHHRIAAPAISVYHDPNTKAPHESESGGVDDFPYHVPHLRLDFALAQSGVPRGWWRSVEHSITGFVVSSFFDEVAHATGRDPIELRLSMLPKGFVEKIEDPKSPARNWPFKSDRMRAVIELARDKSGWGKRVASGHALGFAAHYSFYSYAAQVAEVSMKDGVPKVHRVVCAIDCGTVINPDGVRAQIEGGIVYGLAAALGQKITIENGRVQQSNFHDFPIMTIAEMPIVEVHIVPSGEPPTGTGEPGLPPIAPAVTNAMFNLTGNRVRSLPIS